MLQSVIVTLGMDRLILQVEFTLNVTTNANGCDSTATLNLTINPSTTSSVDVTECDTYTWNGTAYTASVDIYFCKYKC